MFSFLPPFTIGVNSHTSKFFALRIDPFSKSCNIQGRKQEVTVVPLSKNGRKKKNMDGIHIPYIKITCRNASLWVTVLQIRRGNLGINFHLAPLKHIL